MKASRSFAALAPHRHRCDRRFYSAHRIPIIPSPDRTPTIQIGRVGGLRTPKPFQQVPLRHRKINNDLSTALTLEDAPEFSHWLIACGARRYRHGLPRIQLLYQSFVTALYLFSWARFGGCTVSLTATSVAPSSTSRRWSHVRQRYSPGLPILDSSSIRR
jgi:hypothetical protein